MGPLISMLTSLVSGEVSHYAQAMRVKAIIYGLASVLGFGGVCFLLVAGYVALSAEIGALYASLSIAGALLAAALFLLAGYGLAQRQKARQKKKAPSSIDTNAIATTAAITLLPMVLRNKSLMRLALPLAGVAGVAFLGLGATSKPKSDAHDRGQKRLSEKEREALIADYENAMRQAAE